MNIQTFLLVIWTILLVILAMEEVIWSQSMARLKVAQNKIICKYNYVNLVEKYNLNCEEILRKQSEST